MRLLEHKAKDILEREGVQVPNSHLLKNISDIKEATEKIGLPLVMKVQTLSGGRGQSGGIHVVHTIEEATEWYESKIGTFINKSRVEAILCEAYVPFEQEYYMSFSLDAANRKIDFLFSTAGGIDIETSRGTNNLFKTAVSIEHGLEEFKVIEVLSRALVPKERWDQVIILSKEIYRLFLKYDCLLLEINPFVWTVKEELLVLDIHLYMDDNAIPLHEEAKQEIQAMPEVYPQSWLKINYGFDMVILNPQGNLGLLSTGAGLSMAIVDEMKDAGINPINFADVRSGQLKGDPTRLIVMLERFKKFPNLKYIFVSIFAGITDLAEFAESLIKAKDQVKLKSDVEWIIRLEGNNFEKAKKMLEQRDLFVTNSLDESIGRCMEGRKNKSERIN